MPEEKCTKMWISKLAPHVHAYKTYRKKKGHNQNHQLVPSTPEMLKMWSKIICWIF